MNDQSVTDFKRIQAAFADVEAAKLLAADRRTIIERLDANLTNDGAMLGKLLGLPVLISSGIPQGEVWMINGKTGELIAKLENVGE